MTSKHALFFFSLLLIAPAARCAVTVTGAAGTFATGSTFTVIGSGFGSKSPAAPYLWAPFTSNAHADTTLGLHDFSSYQSMAWSAGTGYDGGSLAASDGTGIWTAAVDFAYFTTESQKIYLYRMSKMNFLIAGDPQNWKVLRWWPSSVNYPNIYCSGSNGICYVEDGTGTGFYANFNPNTTNWAEEEFRFQASSQIDLKDGLMNYHVNNVLKANGSLQTRSTARPAYMSNGYILHGVLANKGSWVPAWQDTNRIWYDNVYFDTTWSRVMIGNAATFAACTDLQPQIPKAWSNTNIIVTGNFSGYSNGAAAWLYVFDVDNNVNANGFAITTAGSLGNPSPTLSSISPSTGSYLGGDSITATGLNFSGSVTIAVGTSAATNVILVSGTKITFTVPAGPAGTTVDVVETNDDGQFSTLASTFTYSSIPAPAVTSIDVTSGTYAGGTADVARGTNFVNGATVWIGTSPATGVSFLSSTAISFITPSGRPGTTQAAMVINPSGQSGTLPNAFTYSTIVPPVSPLQTLPWR